jgi:hypothetical protein
LIYQARGLGLFDVAGRYAEQGGKFRLPEGIWNTKAPDSDNYAFFHDNFFGSNLALAYNCGIIDGILGEITSFPEFLVFINGFVFDSDYRNNINNAVQQTSWEKIKAGAEKEFNEIYEKYKKTNESKSYATGRAVIIVVSCFVGIEQLSAIGKTGKLVSGTLDLLKKLSKDLTVDAASVLLKTARITKSAGLIDFDNYITKVARLLTNHADETSVKIVGELTEKVTDSEVLSEVISKIDDFGTDVVGIARQNDFLADLAIKTGTNLSILIGDNLDKLTGRLVDAWKMAAKHADLRTNTTALSKLNDIAGRGRGIDKTKLSDALNSDLGDLLNKATGDDLTNILNRLDAVHVTGSHLDEITLRLNKYPEVKTELLNNPSQFEFFDEVLRKPENYRELAQTGEITTSSKLYQWALGKFKKQILDNAEKLETFVSSNIRSYVDVPNGYKTATQIHLSNGVKRTVPDDFIYSTVRETDPITGDYYKAIIHDSKLHKDVDWTDNQYNLIIKKFEDGASYVDLELRSPLNEIRVGATIRIYKSDVYKSIGTPDRSGTYLSTSKVF